MGLDVGTTTVSVLLFDLESGTLLASRSEPHNAVLPPDGSGAHLQDPKRIVTLSEHLIAEVSAEAGTPDAIGVTGQMHGILYLDRQGEPTSPLYTWLDKRAQWESPDGRSYAELLRERLNDVTIPAGYGVTTHFVHELRGTVPAKSRYAVTLPDYIAMKLSGEAEPVTDPTMAHSFGAYLTREGHLDQDLWHTLGGKEVALPRLSREPSFLGKSASGWAVTTPLGDNQASYLGSVARPRDSLLINVGTSGQVSLYFDEALSAHPPAGIEERPFPGGGVLWVGATLSGGKSIDLLASLVSETDRLINGEETRNPFQVLSDSLIGLRERDPLTVVTKFSGTREDASARGSISGISMENFTLGYLYRGFIDGIADELATLWERAKSVDPWRFGRITSLVAGGNALRLSEPLRNAVSERFSMELQLTPHDETAALGAAVLAYSLLEAIPVTKASRRMVHYL